LDGDIDADDDDDVDADDDCGVQVDGVSLEGFSNEEAVDVLRHTGQVTRLKLAQHHYGSKYEQLLHAAAVGQLLRLLSALLLFLLLLPLLSL